MITKQCQKTSFLVVSLINHHSPKDYEMYYNLIVNVINHDTLEDYVMYYKLGVPFKYNHSLYVYGNTISEPALNNQANYKLIIGGAKNGI